MNAWARPSEIPAATQRSQNTEKISFSGVPARPACVSHADTSAKKRSFMPGLYSRSGPFDVRKSPKVDTFCAQPLTSNSEGACIDRRHLWFFGLSGLCLSAVLHRALSGRHCL